MGIETDVFYAIFTGDQTQSKCTADSKAGHGPRVNKPCVISTLVRFTSRRFKPIKGSLQ